MTPAERLEAAIERANNMVIGASASSSGGPHERA